MKNIATGKHKSAGRIIGEISRAAHIYFQAEFKKYSIGHAQISTLLFIARNEGINQIELAKELNLDKSSITSQLKILESNGFITRHTSDSDARMQQLKVTEKTLEILDPIKKIFQLWTEILLDGFDKEEKAQLFEYLERMRSNAKTKVEQIKQNK